MFCTSQSNGVYGCVQNFLITTHFYYHFFFKVDKYLNVNMHTSIVRVIGFCECLDIQNPHIRILLNQLSAWNKII